MGITRLRPQNFAHPYVRTMYQWVWDKSVTVITVYWRRIANRRGNDYALAGLQYDASSPA